MKKIGVILSILSVLTFGLLPSSGVYADTPADIVTVITNASADNTSICSDSDDSLPDCSPYSYVNAVPSCYMLNSLNYTMVTNPNGRSIFLQSRTIPTLFSVPDDYTMIRFSFSATSNIPNDCSVTVTLSATSDIPEPEPCPDCNEPFIVQLFKDGFWGVATGIVTIIVPIIALFLVFRLVHDLLWGRG